MKTKLILIALLVALLLGMSVSFVSAQVPLFPPGRFPGYTVCQTEDYVSVYAQPRYTDRWGNMAYPIKKTNEFIYLGRVAQDEQGAWWRYIVTASMYAGWIPSNDNAACVSTYKAQ